ncbi:MAG TPA: LysR family transcriptional regulator [Zeimonas sp.]
MIDLNQLHIFERVAVHESFSAAARELGLPRSNVSRAVAKLEESLKTRLMHRTTREVTLTTSGKALFERVTGIMEELDEAVGYIDTLADVPSGPLRVSAGIALGINVLGDALPGFLERYPEIRLELHLESARVDLLSQNIDVALRFGRLPDSSLVAQTLGTLEQTICASPTYLKRHGKPMQPNDLARHRFVDMPTPDGRPRPLALSRPGESRTVLVQPGAIVDEVLTMHRLVRGGVGIGILSSYLVKEDLDDGMLERVLPDWEAPGVPISLLYPSRRELAPSVRAFANFMRDLGADAPWKK